MSAGSVRSALEYNAMKTLGVHRRTATTYRQEVQTQAGSDCDEHRSIRRLAESRTKQSARSNQLDYTATASRLAFRAVTAISERCMQWGESSNLDYCARKLVHVDTFSSNSVQRCTRWIQRTNYERSFVFVFLSKHDVCRFDRERACIQRNEDPWRPPSHPNDISKTLLAWTTSFK